MIVHGLRCPRHAPGVQLVRVRPVDRDRHDAGLIVDEEHFLPRLAAVLRPIDAALGSPAERIAERRDVGDVGVLRMDLELADLADILQARRTASVRPASVDLYTPRPRITFDRIASLPGPDVDDVRIRVRHVDRADRSGRHLAVGHRHPGDAVVLGLEHAAAGRAHVEHVRLRAHAGGRGRSAAAVRTDRSPAQILIRVRIDDDVGVRLRLRL